MNGKGRERGPGNGILESCGGEFFGEGCDIMRDEVGHTRGWMVCYLRLRYLPFDFSVY